MNKNNRLQTQLPLRSWPWSAAYFVLSISLHLLATPFAEDDAYIHIRNATHLWRLGLPYFNTGEPFLSSSSLLWMVILAPTTLAGAYQEHWISAINGILSALAGTATLRILPIVWPSASTRSSLLTCLLVYLALLPSSLALMESPLAACAVLVMVYGILRQAWWWSSVAGLLPFVRPELVLFSCGSLIFQQRTGTTKQLVLAILGLATTAIPIITWYLLMFGGNLPQSMVAKSVVYSISFQDFIRFTVLTLTGGVCSAVWAFVWIFLLICGVCGTIWSSQAPHLLSRRDWRVMIYILLVPLTILLVFAMKRVLLFPWYGPLFTLPVIIALTPVWGSPSTWQRCNALLAVLPVAAAGIASTIICAAPQFTPYGPSSTRAGLLRKVGAALYSAVPSAKVLAPEIGGLGRGYSGELIDAVGLTSPSNLHYHPLAVPQERSAGYLGAVPLKIVEKYKPDVIVGLPTLLEQVRSSSLMNEYLELKIPILTAPRFGTPKPIRVWGNSFLSVLVRRSIDTATTLQIQQALTAHGLQIMGQMSPPETSSSIQLH